MKNRMKNVCTHTLKYTCTHTDTHMYTCIQSDNSDYQESLIVCYFIKLTNTAVKICNDMPQITGHTDFDGSFQNFRFPIDGKSGSLMSLIFCGMFISLTADTARAGAAAIPAWKIKFTVLNYHSYSRYTEERTNSLSTLLMWKG